LEYLTIISKDKEKAELERKINMREQLILNEKKGMF